MSLILTSPLSCWEFLLNNQNADGGWGYRPSSPSGVEPTAWALSALLASDPSAVVARAVVGARKWLVRAQLPDGSWPPFADQPQGCWATSLACQALHAAGGAGEALTRGLEWLVHAWPAEGTLGWRLRQSLFPSRVARQNTSLRGWSWTPGTASWVEPTAHALLLLRALPYEMLSAPALERRELAERMLHDRMCPGGGWNSGNPLVYGVAGVPRVGPTVWALLALQDHAERAEIQLSLRWLASAYHSIRGAASLALANRCLRVYGRPVPALAPALNELYAHHGFFDNVLTFAWVALALRAEATGTV